MKLITLFATMVTATLLLTTPSVAQQHDSGTDSKSTPQKGMAGMMKGGMKQKCAMMMQNHQAAQSGNAAQDVRLQKLTDTMNQASEDRKMDAMAAVVTELVAQRSTRAKMTDQMQSQMMAHMGEHMQSGSHAAMMQCPMMPSGKPGGGGMKPGMMMPKKQ